MKEVQLGEFIFQVPDKYDVNKLRDAIAKGKLKSVFERLYKILVEEQISNKRIDD